MWILKYFDIKTFFNGVNVLKSARITRMIANNVEVINLVAILKKAKPVTLSINQVWKTLKTI